MRYQRRTDGEPDVIGHYTFISMTLNAFEVDVPVGARVPFPREDS